MPSDKQLAVRIRKLTEIGLSLSAEKDTTRLLESILLGAKELSNADAGTLYSVYEAEGGNPMIRAKILHNDSLGIFQGGSSGSDITLADIPLLNADQTQNLENIVSYSINSGNTVNIQDVYNHQEFDFSGMRKIADEMGYRPQSMLTIPMKDHTGEVIGALQLINALSEESGEVIDFSATIVELVESLASQAAIALTNQKLINEQKILLESIIQLVATAIDEKSPYTGDHCRRVPVLTMMIADAAHESSTGPLKNFQMTPEDRYELEIAAWLHDCGKITTPEYIIDKATKLETIHDRIADIATRFEVLKRDAEIYLLKEHFKESGHDLTALEATISPKLDEKIAEYNEQLLILRKHNTGGEFMSEQDMDNVKSIARNTWSFEAEKKPILTDDELYNLTISKGTLTPEEREIINHHIVATINMLESLPFPKHLSNVPEFAGGHHERMDGKGYPKGLTREQMSVQARAMGIADVFEALTARDRPYKPGKTLTEALKILGFMCQDNHIDKDLFQLFIDRKIYQDYADKHLDPRQIDEVNHDEIPGYGKNN